MKALLKTISISLGLVTMFLSTNIWANPAYAVPGVRGYDLVSYHNGPPRMGSGHFAVEHAGVTYLFSSKENKQKFASTPAKYLPAYGGFCAFGASLGKKFFADPTVYELVDGKLYLNLDNGIKSQWVIDIPSAIMAADEHWKDIEDKTWMEANK